MDSFVSPKDEICFLRVSHHISTGLYHHQHHQPHHSYYCNYCYYYYYYYYCYYYCCCCYYGMTAQFRILASSVLESLKQFFNK